MELHFVRFPALRATFSTLRCLAERDNVIVSAKEVMFSPVCWLVGLFTQNILDEFQQSLADPVNFGSAPDKDASRIFHFGEHRQMGHVHIFKSYWEHSDICWYLSGRLNSAWCRGTVGPQWINVVRWVFGVWFFKMVYCGIVMTPRMSRRAEGVIIK